MSTRTIKLKLLTQDGLVKIETSARTFGEFKAEAEVKKLKIDWSSAKLIDRASKGSFELDESVLPAVDSLMFVTPTKTKSGQDLPYKEVKEKIKEFKANGGVVPFNYTQATTKELNEFWNKVKGSNSKKEVAKVVETIKSTKQVQKVEEVKAPDTILVDDIAEVVTKSDLNSEANYLKNQFNK